MLDRNLPIEKGDLLYLIGLGAMTLITIFVGVRLDILVPALLLALIMIVALVLLATLWQAPGSLLLIYAAALPVYFLSLALLYQVSGSRNLIVAVQPWKEVLAVTVISFLLVGFLYRLRVPARFHKLDLLVAFFLFLNMLYLLVPGSVDALTRLYGLRANAFFTLIYLLGRVVPLSKRVQRGVFAALILIGALGGIMAIIETLFLPPTWPVNLGYAGYLTDFLGQTPQGNYGLNWTFETATGLRRASAFFANPLELASSVLVTGMAAFYAMFYFRPHTTGRWAAAISWLLIAFSVVLSVSRASIMAFAFQSFAAAILLRRTKFALFLVGAGLIGFAAAIVYTGPQLVDLVTRTLTFENPSSQGHLLEWIEGATAVVHQPLGLGLGTSGPVGARSGVQVGGENQYVIVAVQLGILGLITYVALALGAIRYSWCAYRSTSGVTRALAFVAATAKLGLLIPAFTANIDSYLFVTYISWWLVGFSVQQLMKPETATYRTIPTATAEQI